MVLALLLALLAPARPAHASAADQLCNAAGYSSGCIGTYTPPSTPSYHEREPREPTCDEACRRRDQEDRDWAWQHMVQPKPLPPIDAVAAQVDRAVQNAKKSDESDDKACLTAMALAAAPKEALGEVLEGAAVLELVPGLDIIVTAAAALYLMKAYADGKVPSLSLSRPSEETCPEAAVADDPCAGIRGKTCDDSTDCNAARVQSETAKGCLDRRVAELEACNQKGARDAPRSDYGKAFNSCNDVVEKIKSPLDAAVNTKCKTASFSCADHETWPAGAESCARATENLGMAQACAAARVERHQKCFADASGHEQTFPDSEAAVQNCTDAVKAHCTAQDAPSDINPDTPSHTFR